MDSKFLFGNLYCKTKTCFSYTTYPHETKAISRSNNNEHAYLNSIFIAKKVFVFKKIKKHTKHTFRAINSEQEYQNSIFILKIVFAFVGIKGHTIYKISQIPTSYIGLIYTNFKKTLICTLVYRSSKNIKTLTLVSVRNYITSSFLKNKKYLSNTFGYGQFLMIIITKSLIILGFIHSNLHFYLATAGTQRYINLSLKLCIFSTNIVPFNYSNVWYAFCSTFIMKHLYLFVILQSYLIVIRTAKIALSSELIIIAYQMHIIINSIFSAKKEFVFKKIKKHTKYTFRAINSEYEYQNFIFILKIVLAFVGTKGHTMYKISQISTSHIGLINANFKKTLICTSVFHYSRSKNNKSLNLLSAQNYVASSFQKNKKYLNNTLGYNQSLMITCRTKSLVILGFIYFNLHLDIATAAIADAQQYTNLSPKLCIILTNIVSLNYSNLCYAFCLTCIMKHLCLFVILQIYLVLIRTTKITPSAEPNFISYQMHIIMTFIAAYGLRLRYSVRGCIYLSMFEIYRTFINLPKDVVTQVSLLKTIIKFNKSKSLQFFDKELISILLGMPKYYLLLLLRLFSPISFAFYNHRDEIKTFPQYIINFTSCLNYVGDNVFIIKKNSDSSITDQHQLITISLGSSYDKFKNYQNALPYVDVQTGISNLRQQIIKINVTDMFSLRNILSKSHNELTHPQFGTHSCIFYSQPTISPPPYVLLGHFGLISCNNVITRKGLLFYVMTNHSVVRERSIYSRVNSSNMYLKIIHLQYIPKATKNSCVNYNHNVKHFIQFLKTCKIILISNVNGSIVNYYNQLQWCCIQTKAKISKPIINSKLKKQMQLQKAFIKTKAKVYLVNFFSAIVTAFLSIEFFVYEFPQPLLFVCHTSLCTEVYHSDLSKQKLNDFSGNIVISEIKFIHGVEDTKSGLIYG